MDKSTKINFLKEFEDKIVFNEIEYDFEYTLFLKMWANLQNKKDILFNINKDFDLLNWKVLENKNGTNDFLILSRKDNQFIFQEINFRNRTPVYTSEFIFILSDNRKIIINSGTNKIKLSEKETIELKANNGIYTKNMVFWLAHQYFGLDTNYEVDEFIGILNKEVDFSNIDTPKDFPSTKFFIDYLKEKYNAMQIVQEQSKNVALLEQFTNYLTKKDIISQKEIEKNLPNFFKSLPKSFEDNTFRTIALMLMGMPMMESIFSSLQWENTNFSPLNDIKKGGIRCQALKQYVEKIKKTIQEKNTEITLSDVVSISLKMDNSQVTGDLDFFSKFKKIPNLVFFFLNDFKHKTESVSFMKSLTKSGNGDPRKYLAQFTPDKWDEITTSLEDFFIWLRFIDQNCPDYNIRDYISEVPFSKIIKDNQSWHHTWPTLLSAFIKKDTVSWDGILTKKGLELLSKGLRTKAKELITKDELDKEGKEQNNCVLTYVGECANDFVRIVSLTPSSKDSTLKTRATIELKFQEDGIKPVQIRGYSNKKITEENIKNIFESLNKNKEEYFNLAVFERLKENGGKIKNLDLADDNLIIHYQEKNEMHLLEQLFKNILEHINHEKEYKQKGLKI